MSSVLILDNGCYELKAGYASDVTDPLRVTNAITRSKDRRVYIGNDVKNCKDYAGLVYRRPQEKGQLYNWECQKVIWDSVFYGKGLPLGKEVDPSDTSLILTEAPYTLPALSSNMDQIVFEEYGFDSYYRCSSGSLVPWNNLSEELYGVPQSKNASPVTECALVIESGFSATHILPVILGEVYWPAVKRVDVGGRLLTNYLKETVSFRYYNMMDETYLMNVVKEKLCFVSTNYYNDIEEWNANRRKNRFQATYVLPDYSNLSVSKVGYVVDPASTDSRLNDHQTLTLANERFMIPEILFNPSDIGLNQSGIAEATRQALDSCPEEVRSLLMANVVLTGGNANFPGYKERMEKEIRSVTPEGFHLRVGKPEDTVAYAWQGGRSLGLQPDMLARAYVTKKDYMEYGGNVCTSRFGSKNLEVTVS